ncbi:TlpA family protein disulfide reductase [Mucilaginibacter ximonensis]|uniref:TlpA family protein disulfide reductase n=1 Tax=Mucilaginibacter ximonensis TaxID=538021 RepID=A0ABW5YB42_9SPHI
MNRSFLKSSALVLCLLTAFTAKAQREIVQKAVDKINSAKNISYTATETGEEFGSSFNNKIVTQLYNRQADGTYQFYHSDLYLPSGKISYFDNGNQQVEINYADSVYELSPDRKKALPPASLNTMMSSIEKCLTKRDDHYIYQKLSDSVIGKQWCYHIRIASKDTLNGSFYRFHVFINKKSYLPLAARNEIRGTIEKGGVKGGVMTMIVSSDYTNIHISNTTATNPVSFIIPKGFKPPAKRQERLEKGVAAPQWTLKSTEGKILSLADLKGKVVLMDFTFNACGACVLALPSLEKLHKKYEGTDVVIVSVNFSDSKEAVAEFIKKNNLKNPIYVNGRALAKAYHVSAAPTFYLINKKGEIDWSGDGYSDDFEREVSASIEALR